MDGFFIKYQLSLVIRLFDTTTGRAIKEKNVRFLKDGQRMHMMDKGGGSYISINGLRENFLIHITIYGYEEKEVFIDYEQMDPHMPVKEVYLLPEDIHGNDEILSLQGKLEGITRIEAISPSQARCFFGEYEERKRIIKLINPYKIHMEHVFYGIIGRGSDRYENIEIAKEIDENTIKIVAPLTSKMDTNSPISRIIYGEVYDGNKYRIRIRDQGGSLVHLVKYEVDGEERFREVDFKMLDEVTLK